MWYNELDAKKLSYSTNSGYWKVNDHCFFNKSECYKYATSVQNFNVTYHFFDEAYQSLDWSKEPEESLDQMYLRRAKQIRDKYNYVILCFSGGADSSNILNTFLNNNIKIDEIMVYYPGKAIEKLKGGFQRWNTNPDNLMFEYIECVEPVLKRLAVTHPEIKITTLDFTETAIDMVRGNNLHKLAQAGLSTTINFAGPYMVTDTLRTRKENFGVVWGVDKPRICYNTVTDSFYTYFLDGVIMMGRNAESFDNFNNGIEYFYHTPDMPEIVLKQSWVIKRHMMEVKARSARFYEECILPRSVTAKDPLFVACDVFDTELSYFEQLIYKDINFGQFQADKQTSLFYLETGSWFFKTNLVDNKDRSYFDGQVKEYIHGIDKEFLIYDRNLKVSKLKPVTTKFYSL